MRSLEIQHPKSLSEQLLERLKRWDRAPSLPQPRT